jgi:regulator of RNase E activity RraA
VVVVADAMGVTSAATFGDILATRMVKRGVAGLVTDGVVRDKLGMFGTGLPIWSAGVTAPAPTHEFTFIGWQEPIACGGTAVFPNDIIVADDDGAVVIPAALVEEVAKAAPELERFEAWAIGEIEKGAKLPGLNPPNEATKARYDAERQKG